MSERERLRIEPARMEDLDEVVALEEESFPTPWRFAFFASELRAEGRYNTVIRTGQGLAAYCFAMYFLDEMHINKIAVAPRLRRRGVARMLMEDAMSWGRRHGVRTVALEVRESNLGAVRFYETLGFTERYRRTRYYPDGETAIVMMRELDH